ncbi:MAG TPA: hypothetical protein VK875_02290, partial [Euzebyales bacterium]|nr:hypothetical protein [Euzebyales bacterium]
GDVVAPHAHADALFWSSVVVAQLFHGLTRVHWLPAGRLAKTVPALCKFGSGVGFAGFSLAETLRLRWQ